MTFPWRPAVSCLLCFVLALQVYAAGPPPAKGKPPLSLSGPEPNMVYASGQLTNSGAAPALDVQIPLIGFYAKMIKPGESVSVLGASPGMGVLEGKYAYVNFTQNAREVKTFEVNMGTQPGQPPPDVAKKGVPPAGGFGQVSGRPMELTRIKTFRSFYDWDEKVLMVEIITKEDTDDVIIILKNRYPIPQRADLVRGVTEQYFEADIGFVGQSPVALTAFGKKAFFNMEIRKTPGKVAERVVIGVQTIHEYREIDLYIPVSSSSTRSPSEVYGVESPSPTEGLSRQSALGQPSDQDLGGFSRRLLQIMGGESSMEEDTPATSFKNNRFNPQSVEEHPSP